MLRAVCEDRVSPCYIELLRNITETSIYLPTASLFQALGCWGRAEASERKNEGGLNLPHFFSCPCFRSSPTTESLEQASHNKRRELGKIIQRELMWQWSLIINKHGFQNDAFPFAILRGFITRCISCYCTGSHNKTPVISTGGQLIINDIYTVFKSRTFVLCHALAHFKRSSELKHVNSSSLQKKRLMAHEWQEICYFTASEMP